MKDTKYIYASFTKLDPKDAGDVDEDLTYSDDEKALDNYVKKLQKSDKKKFDDGEAVKVYLHELNSDGVPVPVRCVEITKTEDDKGYSSEQVEEYDLPDDFKPYGENDDSEKSDDSDEGKETDNDSEDDDESKDKEKKDDEKSSDEEESDEDEKEAEEAAILTDIGYDALFESGIINESWYLFHEPQEDKEKVKDIKKFRDYKYTHLDDLKEKGIPVVGKKTLKRAKDYDKFMATDLARYNHYKATTHQDFPNRETKARWDSTDHLQEYRDRDFAKANKRVVERKYAQQRAKAKERALELKKLKDARAAAATKEKIKNKVDDVKKKAYDKFGGGSHKTGRPVTEAVDYAAFLIGNIYPYEATSFEEFVSELDENMGILLESAVEIDDLDKEALAITEAYVQEATLSFKNRKKLSDDDFGVPSKRKFPLNDKAHVKAAIQRFNYVDSEDERELAKRIIQRMKDFNMMNDVHVGEDNRFKKYLDSAYKDFKESFDVFPFPVAREFSVGAMLPMMGNTKGWGTPLANDSIENVVDRTNAEINNGAVFYNSNDMINDSGISMTDGVIKMESVIPHKNLIFDSEVAKLVKSISDYIDNPKNKFMEDILKKSLNFRKNIYNIKLKDDKSGNDANKVINKIKFAGFRDLDDQGVKAVYEKEVQNLILTLTYDTVADRIRITYEEKEGTGKATKESVEVMVETPDYNRLLSDLDVAYDDATYIINNAPELSANEKKDRLARIERNYNQAKSDISRRQLGTNFFGSFGRKIDANGGYSRLWINSLITPEMMLKDYERIMNTASTVNTARYVLQKDEDKTALGAAAAVGGTAMSQYRLANARKKMEELRAERHAQVGIDDDVFESAVMTEGFIDAFNRFKTRMNLKADRRKYSNVYNKMTTNTINSLNKPPKCMTVNFDELRDIIIKIDALDKSMVANNSYIYSNKQYKPFRMPDSTKIGSMGFNDFCRYIADTKRYDNVNWTTYVDRMHDFGHIAEYCVKESTEGDYSGEQSEALFDLAIIAASVVTNGKSYYDMALKVSTMSEEDLNRTFLSRNDYASWKSGAKYSDPQLILSEASKEDIDPDITDVINKLNNLGYTTKYSCSGHTKSRIKEDGYRNGIYHGALYTTARIVFADDYKLNPPKGWKKKTFDGKIGFYPEVKHYDYSQGVPDDAFDEWKKEYMASLRDWVDKLDKKPGPDENSKSKED